MEEVGWKMESAWCKFKCKNSNHNLALTLELDLALALNHALTHALTLAVVTFYRVTLGTPETVPPRGIWKLFK